MKIESVYWQDAFVTISKLKPGKNDALTRTIGCVAKEDDTFIYISNYYDGIADKWDTPWTAIPKVLVRKREVMEDIDVKQNDER